MRIGIGASGVAFAILFSAWFAATVVCQFHRYQIGRFLKRHDYCAVLPIWTFFAPDPASQDFTLLYRDKDQGGELTPWNVFAYRRPPAAIRWIWNPDKRRAKVIHDMATVWLIAADRDPSDQAILLSVPYLCLLHQASIAPRSRPAVATQLAIASVHDQRSDKPAEIFAMSRFHRI